MQVRPSRVEVTGSVIVIKDKSNPHRALYVPKNPNISRIISSGKQYNKQAGVVKDSDEILAD